MTVQYTILYINLDSTVCVFSLVVAHDLLDDMHNFDKF